jgi:hypothetical protein
MSSFGLMFFGTPHSGPTNDLKVKFGKACVGIAQSMPWKVSNDIMEALKKGSLFSDVLQEHWRHQLEQYQIISFYEGIGNVRSFPGSFGSRIVTAGKVSASGISRSWA